MVCLAWCGVAWGGVELHGVSILGGCPQRLYIACACIISVGCFSVASSGSSSGQQLLCILCMCLRTSSWLCLAHRSVCWRSCAF